MTNGNTDNTVRLGDSETLRALIARALTDALGIETLCCHKREQDAEMELIRDRAYEDATSGTEAAGPARERVRAVLRLHGEANAHMDAIAALSMRTAADGLDPVSMGTAMLACMLYEATGHIKYGMILHFMLNNSGLLVMLLELTFPAFLRLPVTIVTVAFYAACILKRRQLAGMLVKKN